MADSVSGDTLYLVDGSGYIFRAYYALPQNLTNPEGTPVGAVLGFTTMLLKLLTELKAPSIAVVFDAARRNFRYDIYPDYKANREEPPADLIPQFSLIRDATRAFGVPALEQEGYEADDLIATYARLAREAGRQVVIVGTDKDLMQLVRDGVTLYDPIKYRTLGAAEVLEKFGVPPERVVDVQALAGDSVDNVPGVPGIGIKTAAELITQYGDLETLLAQAGEIRQPKRRETLIANADKARISKRLCQLDENAPVPVPLDELHAHDPRQAPDLIPFLQKQGFRSVITRLGGTPEPAPVPAQAAMATTAPAPALPPPSENRYTLITDLDELDRWIARAQDVGVVAVDTETTALTPAKAKLVGISLASELGQGAYIPVGHRTQATDLLSAPAASLDQLPMKAVLDRLRPLLEDPSVLKIGHNIKYDWQMFAAHGIEVGPCDDTMLLSYVIDGAAHGHGMDELARLHCAHDTIKYEDVTGTGKAQVTFDCVEITKACDYAAEDAEITLRLHKILKPRLILERVTRVYEDVERPLIPVIAEMERTGIRVDPATLKSLSADFGRRLTILEAEVHALAGHAFNLASPKQLGAVLFEELGLPHGKRTAKSGEWSTAAGVLEELAAEGHAIAEKILDWRELAKLKSTYADALITEIAPATGRIHTSFSMAGTNTGRLSSSDPNLQNIPVRSEEGRRIRAAFVAEPGWRIVSVDYSQVELRIAAAMADIAALKEAFRSGVDIHAHTAAQVFGIPDDAVTSEQRRQAKTINFGIIYGISGFGLARQLGCSPAEANRFIQMYLARFPELQTYFESRKEEARATGCVRTLYGRKCVIAGIHDRNAATRAFAERQATNAPLQGTAADIMKIAMARMPEALRAAGLKARLLLQVHDELVFEAPEAEAEATAALARDIMQSSADIGVPLTAESGIGLNWADAK